LVGGECIDKGPERRVGARGVARGGEGFSGGGRMKENC